MIICCHRRRRSDRLIAGALYMGVSESVLPASMVDQSVWTSRVHLAVKPGLSLREKDPWNAAFSGRHERSLPALRFTIGGGHIWGVAWGRRRLWNLLTEPDIRGRSSLIALLAFTGDFQCKGPRDIIYSFLGPACEQERTAFGPPDRGRSHEARRGLYRPL